MEDYKFYKEMQRIYRDISGKISEEKINLSARIDALEMEVKDIKIKILQSDHKNIPDTHTNGDKNLINLAYLKTELISLENLDRFLKKHEREDLEDFNSINYIRMYVKNRIKKIHGEMFMLRQLNEGELA